jgi:hypothetical protein
MLSVAILKASAGVAPRPVMFDLDVHAVNHKS